MKRIVLTITGILVAANSAFATSPVIPINPLNASPVEVANLMLNKTVTDCIKQTEKNGLSAVIGNIDLTEYNDVSIYRFSGRLMGIDTVEGTWSVDVEASYNQPPFGTTGYTCAFVYSEEF